MKYISLILSVLILTMAVMPCSDRHTCDEESQEISLGHDHSEDEKDHCSPFCVCSCCGMKVIFKSSIIACKPNTKLNSSYQFDYSFLYSFSFKKAIWHPPTFC